MVSVNELPDTCPFCHHAVHAKLRQSSISGTFDPDGYIYADTFVQSVYQCPRSECQHFFITLYKSHIKKKGHELLHEWIFGDLEVLPQLFKPQTFAESVTNISPMFCAIYNEATHAEALHLLNVAGPGFRKALEFLIKDFLISEEPDKAEGIKKMDLGNALANKISDANIKKCAQRAAWLGNDETHYERRWSNHDLSDLKRLVKLTVNWIESTLLTRDYEHAMPNSKAQTTTSASGGSSP